MEPVTIVRHSSLIALSLVLAVALILFLRNSITAVTEDKNAIRRASSEDCHGKRLVVVSFDGFRWNYLNRTKTPNFDSFIKNGVQARSGLLNAFTTITIPNHYTLATGLWEESHGLIANHIYDPVLNKTFDDKNESSFFDPVWFDTGAEPVWVANQLRGNRHSGVIMWVGGDAPVHNTLPTKHIRYDLNFKNETKIETMIKWFQDDCLMNLGMIYFPEPDRFGHRFGPESDQVTRMIGGLDELVGYMIKRFEEEGLLNNTNIILTSDHGFASTPRKNYIYLDNIIDRQKYLITSFTPVAGIWPHPGSFEEIYEKLTTAAKENGHFTVYKKEDIPERYHYKRNQRTPPIILVADEFYSFTTTGYTKQYLGDHGYDNRLKDMHPFFLAMGPDFKSGFAVETFDSVDVYPLMCHLLSVQPPANNGSMKVVSTLLKAPYVSPRSSGQMEALLPIILASVLLVFVIVLIIVTLHIRGHGKGNHRADGITAATSDDELYTRDGANVPLL